MNIEGAVSFLAAHARVLDRRRGELLLAGTGAESVLAALDGYRNPDGGYGWGLEPDLRSPESQPVGAMMAFAILAELAPFATTRAAELCDWLDARSLPDGGLPMVLTITDPAACAGFWATADATVSSLQMTAQVAAGALLVGGHDPAVRNHPWPARATRWCLEAIDGIDTEPVAHELLFAIRFLDALAEFDTVAEFDTHTAARLGRLARFLPPDGVVRVQGGAADERLRPLDFAPRRDSAARALFSDETITAERDRLAARQQADGGWSVDFTSAAPAATLEWRGYATVSALAVLSEQGDRAPRP